MKIEKKDKKIKSTTEDTSQKVKKMKYTLMDICVCCGAYMPEGTGMVCRDCMAAIDED